MRGTGLFRLLGYMGWFFSSFLLGIYLTFPLDEVKGVVTRKLEEALGKGKQGSYGVDPRVQIGSLSLSGFGVQAERLQVQLPSRDPDPGPTLDIDELTVRVRPWTLLSKVKTVSVDAELYDGDIDAVVSLDDKGGLHHADVEIDEVDLGRLPAAQAALGVPVAGKLSVDARLELGTTPEKEGNGQVKVSLEGLSMGPGNLKLAAAFGGFELPTIEVGNLTGDIAIQQGKGTLNNMKLAGRDVQAELLGEVFLKQQLGAMRLELDGWFMPTASFLEREQKFKSLLQLGESLGGGASLGKAKDEEGRYWFSAKGTASSPAFALSRDGGKRLKGKASKPGAPPPAEARRSKREAARTVGDKGSDPRAVDDKPATEKPPAAASPEEKGADERAVDAKAAEEKAREPKASEDTVAEDRPMEEKAVEERAAPEAE